MFVVNFFLLVLFGFCHFVASENAVVCYYGTWATYRSGLGKFDVANIDINLCTHIIYTFAGIDSQGKVISLDPYLDLPDNYGRDNFGKFTALKQKKPNLKTLLAVGGWNEGSAKYSTMAADASLRKNFVDSALEMLTRHGFDGLDVDWEYPNRRDTVHGEADIDNFTTLLKEVREVFVQHGLLLTAAVSSVRAAASQSYNVSAIAQYLDIVNIMTYDMHGAWDDVTGHNSPLHQGEGDEEAVTKDLYTVDQALDYWIGSGCPPEKIAVGVPFYGRTFTLKSADVNGLRAPVSGAGIAGPYTATSGFMGYNELCSMFQKESWIQRYDSLAKVPYATKNKDWISYDDAASITSKVEYAKSLGISKIMMWSIETDDFHGTCGNGANPLLNAINTALNDSFTTPSSSNTQSSSDAPSSSSNSDSSSSTSEPGSTAAESSSTIAENICTAVGFIPKPGDCTSFYYCLSATNGDLVPKEFKCPANLYWDQSILSCNYPELVKC